ncbi:MAG TPA: tetratricopeptide repeat protein [Rhodoblastus sp.]|nr:tetratricopeptide repeat protein [Rhodoblastus sp.]
MGLIWLMRRAQLLILLLIAGPGICAGPGARADAPSQEHGAAHSPEQMRQQASNDLLEKLRQAPDAGSAASIRAALTVLWSRSGSPTADLLMSRADSLLNSGQAPQAAMILDKVVQLYPDWALGWRKLAQSALMQGDADAAMADLDHALAADSRNFLAMGELAALLRGKGRDAEALNLLKRALQLDPKNDALRKEAEQLQQRIEGEPI